MHKPTHSHDEKDFQMPELNSRYNLNAINSLSQIFTPLLSTIDIPASYFYLTDQIGQYFNKKTI